MESKIQIDDINFNLIKKRLAYPQIDALYLEDDQIKDLCILPSLRKYFIKFPIKEEYSQPIGGEVKLKFPDENTFGVIDCRIVDAGMAIGTGGSFWDLVLAQKHNVSPATGSGSYGVKGYNPNGLQYVREYSRQNAKTQQNLYTTNKFRVNKHKRQLTAYSSISGKLNVIWAKFSYNFDDVRYEHIDDVISLCQAEYLMMLADSAGIMVNSTLEVSINFDWLKEKAQELFNKVEEKWNAISDVVLVHSS